MPFEIKEVVPTPNPNAMKFVLNQPISDRPLSFLNIAAAHDHSLAKQLFGIAGVAGLLILGDFVTINKSPDAKWSDIKKNVKHMLSKA